MAVGDKFLVFPEQVVIKSTQCANCVWFDGDTKKTAEEWAPTRNAMIAKIKKAIEETGIQFPGWDRADIGLKVAELTRTGMDIPTAIKTIEQQVLQAAVAHVGSVEKLYTADERYAMVASMDADIASGKIGTCRGAGEDGNGNSLRGFRVFSAYHCHNWSGREGWSVAHEGRALDPLPGELVEIADAKAREKAK